MDVVVEVVVWLEAKRLPAVRRLGEGALDPLRVELGVGDALHLHVDADLLVQVRHNLELLRISGRGVLVVDDLEAEVLLAGRGEEFLRFCRIVLPPLAELLRLWLRRVYIGPRDRRDRRPEPVINDLDHGLAVHAEHERLADALVLESRVIQVQ
ncbi:MAG: hypothetical protein R3B97_05585 [Dehalococcoidia bacterium]